MADDSSNKRDRNETEDLNQVPSDLLPDFNTMTISYKNEKKKLLEPVEIETGGVKFSCHTIVGHGSFGVVFQGTKVGTNESVAIKKVLQDRRFKNRELEIMELLNHPNVIQLMHSFYTTDRKDRIFLNLVMEYVPETLYVVCQHYSRAKQTIPALYCKLYMYQLFRALGYIHALGVCHRDIKPQNLLLDPTTGAVKLCDFGSAKILIQGKPNVSYICSRYYRAPELIFGARDYTTCIDIWSMGCVMAELYIGKPLFPGESGVDQLVEVIKVLGAPSSEEIQAMNENYTDFKFPVIKAVPWSKVFSQFTPQDAVTLMGKLLSYIPGSRGTALQICADPYFDALREEGVSLPGNKPLPPLFDFSQSEFETMGETLRPLLVPPHYKPEDTESLNNDNENNNNNNDKDNDNDNHNSNDGNN